MYKFKCKECGKKFESNRKTRKFCSITCSKKGKNHKGQKPIPYNELFDKLEPFLKLGNSLHLACHNAKVCYKVVLDKMKLTTEEAIKFKDDIDRAKNHATELARSVVIKKINEGDDYNARWRLNKKDPDFKDKVENEHSGKITVDWGLPINPRVDPNADEKDSE